MMAIRCPECQQLLRLTDNFAGKRVRCSACKHDFVVPEDSPQSEEPLDVVLAEPDPVEEDFREQEKVPTRRPRRRRIRKSGGPQVDVVSTVLPLILGLGAIACVCAPIVSAALGWFAITQADAAITNLVEGPGADLAEKQLQLARLLGQIGIGLSFAMLALYAIGAILRATH